VKNGRTIGVLLVVAGGVVALIGLAWLLASRSGGGLQTGGALVGAMLLALPVLILAGAGAFLIARSRTEAAQQAEQAQLRRILDTVESRGSIPISDLVLELRASRDTVQRQIHSLVGLGIFSGYINWEDGVLYSAQASSLRSLEKCKRCGGQLKLAGKGVITCPYCGTEYFLN
jgi:hypothetical protein